MKKYKQTVIPEVSTANWKTKTYSEARKKVMDYYRTHYLNGKKVTNQHLGITVEFDPDGADKTSRGGAIYLKKKCLVEVLSEMIQYAEYSNWGDRKAKDKPSVIGFLNFKVKVKIDEKIENIHLVIRVTNDGKFHYTMEVNSSGK